jgi:predicted nuclease of predicted toxin-antitoxin system
VYDHDLVGASDPFIFDWARKEEFTAVVSTDRDFVHLAERAGPPPKVIRIDRCDFPAKVIEQLLRREALRIHDFSAVLHAILSPANTLGVGALARTG